MKRVLVFHFGTRGGGPNFTAHIAAAMVRTAGLEVSAIYNKRSHFATKMQQLNCETLSLALPGRNRLLATPWVILRARQKIRKFVAEMRPSLVICGMGHPANAFLVDCVTDRATYAYILHDAYSHPGDSFRAIKWMERIDVGRASCVITLSEHVAAGVRNEFPGKRVNVLWHPPFVPERAGFGVERLPVGNKLKILFFGRIQKYKGLELLVEACQELKNWESSYELRVVGEGNISKSVSEMLKALNAQIYNSFVAETEVRQHFSWADCVILPYIEASQSGVVATAVGYGKPVIATPVGGLSEQVARLRAGFVAGEVSSKALSLEIEAFRGKQTSLRPSGSTEIEREWCTFTEHVVQSTD